MIKVKREKSLRLGIAALTIPFIMGLSGCNRKDSNLSNALVEKLVDSNDEINRLEELLPLYENVNNKGLFNNYGKVDGLIYKNYPSNDVKEKEDYRTIAELEEELSQFDKLSYLGKLDLIAYINKTVNKYSFESKFETLYRIILTRTTNINCFDDNDSSYNSYLDEGRRIAEINKDNEVEALRDYYQIKEKEAKLLYEIIKIRKSDNFYEEMKKDPEFGTEDYICGNAEYCEYMINQFRRIELEMTALEEDGQVKEKDYFVAKKLNLRK